jgi:hypothetical protein
MKRTVMTLAAVVGMAAAGGTAKSDPGGFAPPPGAHGGYPPPPAAGSEFSAPNTLMGLGAPAPGKPQERYGLLPALRKTFRIGGDGCNQPGCGGGHTCKHGLGKGHCPYGCGGHGGAGHGGGGYGGGGYGGGYGGGHGAGNGYPPVMQGTLVFPHQTFVRSPRDFFMYEPGR